MAHTKKTRNLSDLAEKAGVTVATASLALRDSSRLSDAVKKRIRSLAEEDGFKPRSYKRRAPAPTPAERFKRSGPILFVDNSQEEEDPVGQTLLTTLGKLANGYGIEFRSVARAELAANPALAKPYDGLYFYNDPPEVEAFRGKKPMVQIFGWKPCGPTCDRFTADDDAVIELACEHFAGIGVERVVIVWRPDMVLTQPAHPRLTRLPERLRERGIESLPLPYGKQDTDFVERLQGLIAAGSEKIGFFGFNAMCGLKLCCGLDSLGLMQKYGWKNVINCDRAQYLKNFWPHPGMIDLQLPIMAERALEALLWRMENPEAPPSTTLQFPRLLLP